MLARLRRSAFFAVPGAVLALILTFRIVDPGGVLEDLRLRVFDGYQRLAPRDFGGEAAGGEGQRFERLWERLTWPEPGRVPS